MQNNYLKSILTVIVVHFSISLFSQLSVSNIYDMTSTGGVFTSNFFRTVAVDVNGDVWAGTNGQKLYRFNGNVWEPATTFTTQSFRFITPNPNGGIWVAQSGSTGTDAINGGVDSLDSTYVRTHYGSIEGLVSRYTTSLTRMNNGDVVAVHAPNTTGGVVSGGGIDIISNGNVSSILNGLPSGAFANDRKCWAVGSNGSSQFWVGVERACNTSGVCNYGYIAKYDNLGNHLGNIDISNSLIPFTNTSASTIVRSIHFTNDNKVFIGLFSGGVAVYDLSSNGYTMVNETNSPFPAGASVNNQAIYSVGNEVFIGTSAGLLIYNSNGLLTNPASYQLINTGLPSNSVNGISQGPDGHIWLATSAGIVEMASSTLSGSVNNSIALFAPGTISHLPLDNSKVYLKDMVTGIYLDSVVTGVSGSFTFPFPTSSNPIQLEAFHTLNNNTYSCKIPNVVPSDINVNLSEGLWQQVMDSLPSLNSFQTEASFFWDLLTTYPSFQGYSVADIQANLQQFKHLSAQNHANELEVLARMIVFKEVMQSYGYNSLEISTNLVSATTDFLTGIFSEVFSKEKLNLDAYASTLVSDAKKEIFKLAIEQAVEISDPVISKLCSYITDVDLRVTIEASLKAAIVMVNQNAKLDAGEDLSTSLIFEQIKEDITSLVNLIFTKALFEQYYIKKTKQNITTANVNLNSANTTSNFITAANNANANIQTSQNLSTNVITGMNNFSTASEAAGQAETLFNAASTIAAFTGFGLGYAVILKSMGTAAQVMKHGLLASSVALGGMRMYYLKAESLTAANESFIPALHTIPDNNYQPISLIPLNDALTNYQNQLQVTMDFVQNNDQTNAIDAMINLYYLDSVLAKQYYITSAQMLTAAPQYHLQSGNGDNFTNSIIIGGIEDNRSKRRSFSNFFSAYIIDSTDNSLIDSILFIGNDIIADGLDLFDSLSFYNVEIENIPVEPHLLDLGVLEQNPFVYGQTKTVRAVVKNIGQSDINNVYGKFQIGGGFNAIQDSVYLGTVVADQIDTLEFQVTAPTYDTIVHFTIDLNASNGEVDGIGGALMVNGGNPVQVSEIEIEKSFVKLWPNPVKNELSISTNSNAFNLQIFNLQGKLMHSSYSNGSAFTVDVKRFENGLYLIQGVKDGSILFQDKFIKL